MDSSHFDLILWIPVNSYDAQRHFQASPSGSVILTNFSSLGAGKPIFWVPSQKSAISLPVCRQAWIWYNSIQSLFSLVNFQKKLVKKCFSEIFNMFLPKSSPYLKYSGNITGESCSLPTGWLMRRKGLICDVFIVWKYEVRIGVFKSEIKEIFLRNPV